MSWSWYSPKIDDITKLYNQILKVHEAKFCEYDECELENLKNEISIMFINHCGELPSFEIDKFGYITEVKGEKVVENK